MISIFIRCWETSSIIRRILFQTNTTLTHLIEANNGPGIGQQDEGNTHQKRNLVAPLVVNVQTRRAHEVAHSLQTILPPCHYNPSIPCSMLFPA